MSAIDIRQELQNFIDQEDETSLKKFYKLTKAYIEQRREDKLIAEAEEDIAEGRIYSQDEIKNQIRSWTE